MGGGGGVQKIYQNIMFTVGKYRDGLFVELRAVLTFAQQSFNKKC